MTSSLLAWLLAYKYWIIFPLAIVQGPIVMPVCGFLIRLGVLDPLPTYFLLVATDFTGDIGWYFVGRYGARWLIERWGKYLSITMVEVERLEQVFARHQVKILFISKITMGFGFALATLIAAGAAKVPFRTYALINIFGGFIWTGLLMGAGYFFGNAYLTVGEGLRIGFLISTLILVALALWGFSGYLRKRYNNGIV